MHPAEFLTQRLRLAPAALKDVDRFHALLIDPGVRRYLCDDKIYPRERALEFVEASLESFRTRGMGLWLAHPVSGGDAMGFFLLRPDDIGARAELIYAFLPLHWAGGLAVEGARALIDHAFTSLACEEICAELDEPNRASARVAEKLGMIYSGTRPGPLHPLLRYFVRRSQSATR